MEQYRKFLLFVVVAMCFAALASTLVSDVRAEEDMKSIANSVNAFSFDLYMKCRKPNENLFLSPYSAAVALTMAYAGARGETESQMAKVLHYAPGQGTVHKALSDLQRAILSSGGGAGPELNIANALWGQQGYKFEEPFLDLLNRDYGSPLRTVDFQGNPGAAAERINEWASHETKGIIKDVVTPGDFSALTRLILANAIYFKGMWRAPFSKNLTTDEDFTLPDGNKERVKMMKKTADFVYAESEDFQVLEVPYKGEALSMVVFLPRRCDMLTRCEETLTSRELLQTMASMQSTMVQVFLPRFKLTGSYRLNDTLTTLGMRNAFLRQKADFTEIGAEKPRLFIDQVLQKTFAEVNELGTEAAAVTFHTALAGAPDIRTPPIPVFRADHPFIFLIRHRPSNCILFMGRVTSPPAAGKN